MVVPPAGKEADLVALYMSLKIFFERGEESFWQSVWIERRRAYGRLMLPSLGVAAMMSRTGRLDRADQSARPFGPGRVWRAAICTDFHGSSPS